MEAVLVPQRLELVVFHVAGDAASHLVAEILDARVDHRLVVFVVPVHVRSPSRRPRGRRALSSGQGARSGRARECGPDRKSTRLKSQSLMRISYAVFCLKKKNKTTHTCNTNTSND